jgi:hypothetical protein
LITTPDAGMPMPPRHDPPCHAIADLMPQYGFVTTPLRHCRHAAMAACRYASIDAATRYHAPLRHAAAIIAMPRRHAAPEIDADSSADKHCHAAEDYDFVTRRHAIAMPPMPHAGWLR